MTPNEEEFPFVIEDPIDPTYNPAYTVLAGKHYHDIIFEFQRAYMAIARKAHELLEVPYNSAY